MDSVIQVQIHTTNSGLVFLKSVSENTINVSMCWRPLLRSAKDRKTVIEHPSLKSAHKI